MKPSNSFFTEGGAVVCVCAAVGANWIRETTSKSRDKILIINSQPSLEPTRPATPVNDPNHQPQGNRLKELLSLAPPLGRDFPASIPH
jgi:hypothetical protein